MPIVPDTKNWTWVLERPCEECGFDVSTLDPTSVARLARENAAEWPALLSGRDPALRSDESTWSRLEYAAHVRDVFRIFHTRLDLMLDSTDPLFPNWDQDKAAVAERYNEQDPDTVSGELVDSGNELAAAFDLVPSGSWERTGHRSDGASFTIATLSRYFIHDVVHHLHDVGVSVADLERPVAAPELEL
jgi:hypothetical protein